MALTIVCGGSTVRLSQCGRNRRQCRIIFSVTLHDNTLVGQEKRFLSQWIVHYYSIHVPSWTHTDLCVHWFYSFDGVCVCGHDLVCVLLVNSSWSNVWLYLGVCVCVCVMFVWTEKKKANPFGTVPWSVERLFGKEGKKKTCETSELETPRPPRTWGNVWRTKTNEEDGHILVVVPLVLYPFRLDSAGLLLLPHWTGTRYYTWLSFTVWRDFGCWATISRWNENCRGICPMSFDQLKDMMAVGMPRSCLSLLLWYDPYNKIEFPSSSLSHTQCPLLNLHGHPHLPNKRSWTSLFLVFTLQQQPASGSSRLAQTFY